MYNNNNNNSSDDVDDDSGGGSGSANDGGGDRKAGSMDKGKLDGKRKRVRNQWKRKETN